MPARDIEEVTELADVLVRRLVAAIADDRNGLLTGQTSIADFKRKIVKQAGKSKLVPLQPMVNGYEVVVDIRVIVISGFGAG